MNKNFAKTSTWSVTIILVLAVLIGLNWLSANWFKRFDLTANQLYSLSAVSRQTARDLSDDLQVKIYFSQDLPVTYQPLRQQVDDLLSEYASYSSRFKITPVKPDDLDKGAEELKIPQLQFNQVRQDKLEVVNGYLGLAIFYQEKKEVLPVVQDVSQLEYQLTTVIKKLTTSQLPQVGIAQDYGALSLSADLQSVQTELAKLYQVQTINLQDKDSLNPALNTLILPGLQAELPPEAFNKLDDWLMRGGKRLLILTDQVQVTPNLSSHQSANNLSSWLTNYGITVGKDLVLDRNNTRASFNQGFITFTVNYPLWPRVDKEYFDKDNAAVSQMEGLVLPWATSLNIDSSKVGADASAIVLAKSSSHAWVRADNNNLLPNQNFYNQEAEQQYNFAVLLSGQLTAAFGAGIVNDAQIIVVADADFIRDRFLQVAPQNLLFFQNLVDGLTLDANLATIRAKQIELHPLKDLTNSQKQLVRYGNIFGMTTLVLLVGLLRYFWRKKTKYFSL